MRILFMGTPDIAATCLASLIKAGHDICGVFTREDKPVGRKQILTAPPVKRLAGQYDIPVWQPATLRCAEIPSLISGLLPDCIVVVAYGRILPPALLSIAPLGCINLHASLLPKYRGAAPIQWAILNGEKWSGVTVMQMDEGIDTGDILVREPVPIGPEMTSGELFEKVSLQGAKTLVSALEKLSRGELVPIPQQEDEASKAPALTKEMSFFDFTWPAARIHNWVRGMDPWPIASFLWKNQRIKVRGARLAQNPNALPPATVLCLDPLTIACSQDAIQLLSLTPESGKSMTGTAWAAGRRLRVGDCL